MDMFFLVCAVVGSTVIVLQFILSVIGVEHHGLDGHDGFSHDMHHDGSWFFGIISFRAVVAAVAFLGIGGLAATKGGLTPYAAMLISVGTGAGAMLVVAWTMHMLHGLHSEGNVNIQGAVGVTGTVYLTIPGANAGLGKVTVTLQNRSMEYPAVTRAQVELPTGSAVVVTSVIGSDTLEVEPAIQQ